MIVTKIEQGKKNQNRANVYVDGEFSFALYLDTIVRHGLAAGQEITQEKIDEIVREDELEKAYDRAIRFIGYRMRSEKEVRDKLKSLGYQDFVIEEVPVKLKKLNLINDLEFAHLWVQDRINLKPKGKKALFLELRSKGISEEVANSVLGKVNTDDELELARKLAGKKSFTDLPDKDREKKLTQFLLRRGFGWDVVKRVIEESRSDKA
jgi:regulatory protein